ncbi:MAG: glucoamylase family protein [Flavisolibacter sp.]
MPLPNIADFNFLSLNVNNGGNSNLTVYDINASPTLRLSFSSPVDRSTVPSSIIIKNQGTAVTYTIAYTNNDSTVIIQPSSLSTLTKYTLTVSTSLHSKENTALKYPVTINLFTSLNSPDKFPRISDSALLDLVQQQTFKYFWDFAHPVSGLARERNTDVETVTTGGSGFGIMAIITAVNRNFISRSSGLQRMQKITGFLKNTAQRFHGAFPHWMNGSTGAVIPFSPKDNGADLVETSFLMEGLLTSRQFFSSATGPETALRTDIDSLWRGVQWSWFRKNNESVLYWHWSPDFGWDMNFPIHGWDEALMPYVLAASSLTFAIPKTVYDNGWALQGAIKNGKSFYGIPLPLGPDFGGPLFFAHYSFLGINPNSLSDAYADYGIQNKNHSLINYNYCLTNPKGFYGYSDSCWGLTASDEFSGYSAHSPTNDDGVITPSAALSSFPYTPNESMKALHFFYYKLGDKIWGQYGFTDAFSLQDGWFASSYLAIDQGPIIDMIENYRSALLWNLFMSCPEIKTGMRSLGFLSPNL